MSTAKNMSRKRPAPGTAPVGYGQQNQQMPGNYSQPPLTDDQFFNWGASSQDPAAFASQPMYGIQSNPYPTPQNSNGSNMPTNQSNQVARRPANQVVPRPPQANGQWPEQHPGAAGQQPQQQETPIVWSDDINELVAKSKVAKREAQSKRKQIPPFVLKLHSFLENPKNTELIRWADDGKSFIVLNEDEFANKLIPELFKHNNYASFVRQLNMYGFHKKVGLSDNSMRASERKAKSPSEYWNPYFRKGYPDLLWLIQKPKGAGNSKPKVRGKSEDREDDDELLEDPSTSNQFSARPQLTLGQNGDSQALTQEQFASVQRELTMIRRQQSQITHMLATLKREHDALVDQAGDYHNKHSRHEHSINAILTFLATLYNRSLQNHEGAADIAKIFQNTLNQEKNGGLVDVDNLTFDMPENSMDQLQPPHKRQRLLLTDGSEDRANTLSPSSAASPMPRTSRRSSHMGRSPQSAHVEEIFDADVNQPNHNYPTTDQRQQDMMSLIHDTNARNSGNTTPVPDFSHVLNDLESSGGTTPVSAAQKAAILKTIHDSRRPQSNGNDSRALISPVRSNSQAQFDNRLASTKQDLDQLAQLQAAQDKSVENLTNLLQPLSPSGSIPGIGDGQDVPPAPLDIDAFLGHDYFTDYNNDTSAGFDFSQLNNSAYNNNNNTTTGFDFTDSDPLFENVDDKNLDSSFLNTYDDNTERKVESLASSSEAPTPKQPISDAGDWDGMPIKRRRRS